MKNVDFQPKLRIFYAIFGTHFEKIVIPTNFYVHELFLWNIIFRCISSTDLGSLLSEPEKYALFSQNQFFQFLKCPVGKFYIVLITKNMNGMFYVLNGMDISNL